MAVTTTRVPARTATMSAATYKERQREAAFMATVLEMARTLGWRCYHTFDSRRSEKGFPDLCCVRNGQLIAWECKTNSGRVTRAQKEWLALMASIPEAISGVIRPQDWDEIEAILRGSS